MTRARHTSRAQLTGITYARRFGFAAVLALVVGSIAVSLVPGWASPAPVLGVYAGPGDPGAVGDFAATLGTQPHYAMDFLDGRSWSQITQSDWPYSAWKGKGYTMIW